MQVLLLVRLLLFLNQVHNHKGVLSLVLYLLPVCLKLLPGAEL